METEGWVVLRPDDLTVREQLALLSQAVHVAGVAAGALDLVCFLSEPLLAINRLELDANRSH